MGFFRRIIRKKVCRPVIFSAILIAGIYMTSDKWMPYISNRLYQEGASARENGREPVINAEKKVKTKEKDTNTEINKNKDRETAGVSDNEESSDNQNINEDSYRSTAEDIKKTIRDTKEAANKAKSYLNDAKERGTPIIEGTLPDVKDSTPAFIQDGIDTAAGIRERLKNFAKDKAEKIKDKVKTE